jgi:hypothetical protein
MRLKLPNPPVSIPGILFLAFFLLYAAMSAPELDWGDAGEAQLAIWTGGLSHPTGYPLFLMVGWLWSHALALVGIAPTRAVTLFSVASGAAAVACIVPATTALIRRTVPNPKTLETLGYLPGIIVAVAFGLSRTFWSQALLAEVYTFHSLLLVLFLWAMWSEKQRLGVAALLYGIFLSHHRTAILWAPGLLVWLWLEQRAIFQPRTFIRLLALVLLPQLAYLYIPLCGIITPYLHQALANGQTLNLYDGSLQAFTDHILGTVFAADVGLREPLAARLGRIWGLLILNVSFFTLIPLLLLGRRGKPSHPSTSHSHLRADFILLLSGGGLTLLFGLLYAIGDVEVMFIPTWLVLLWLATIAIARLTATEPRIGAFVGFWVAVLVLVARLPYAPESRADHTAPRELVNELLAANAPTNAILITNDRNEMVPFWYAQFAEGQRPEMLGVFPLITPRPEHATVQAVVDWALPFNRPVYLTKPMPGLALRYDLEPATPPLVRVIGSATLPTTPPQESDLAPDLTVTAWQPPATLQAGETVSLTVALVPLAPSPAPVTLSLQLFDAQGAFITQQDIPPDVFYPPAAWTPNDPVRYRFTLPLPDSLAQGEITWRLSAYVLNEDGTFTSVGRQILLGSTAP